MGMMPTTLKKAQVWSEAPIRALLRFQPVCCFSFRQPDIAISGVQILPTQPHNIRKISILEACSELPGRGFRRFWHTRHHAHQSPTANPNWPDGRQGPFTLAITIT